MRFLARFNSDLVRCKQASSFRCAQLIFACLLICSSFSSLNATTETPDPLNVVVVYIDDMGWKDLSCYGSTYYETPVIDQMAAEGIRFTDAYAASQICSPSRRAMLSGKYPSRSNFTDLPHRAAATGRKLIDPIQADIMPNSDVLFPEIFQAAGYYTGFIGKWHLEVADESEMATEHGFDLWDEISSEGSGEFLLVDDLQDPKEVSEITDKSIAFIEDAITNEQPFMLYMSHRTVHVQLQTTPELHAKYDAKAAGENGQDNPYMAGMVEDLDSEMGRFFDALETLGVADNTLVVFTSDNGGLEQESGLQVTTQAPLRGGKGTQYEGGVRVPLIIKGPGIQEGALTSTQTIQTDLYPTLIELAGLNEDGGYVHDGVSLASLVQDGTNSSELDAREAIFWHYPDYKARMVPSTYVRKGDWVLIAYHEQEVSPYGGKANELFDLSTDIGQTTNLIHQYPLKAAELYADILVHRQDTAAQMPTADPAYVWDGPSATISLPGRFEAEDYDYGGEGVGYHDVDGDAGTDVYRTDSVDIEPSLDEGAGFNITSATADEWLNYHVDVDFPGLVDIHLRVATGSDNKQVILTLDDAPLATVNVPNTGGDQVWATVTAHDVALPSGEHVLKVEWGAQGGPNLNWIDVESTSAVIPVAEGSFENPINIAGNWAMCPEVWNDSASSQYEVGSKHLSAGADGTWFAQMDTVGTISQDLATTVTAGDTLDVSFYLGSAIASKNTAGGGVVQCAFLVGGVRYEMEVPADNTSAAADSWQLFNHSVTVANTGNLVLEFTSVSGTPWIDHIGNVFVVPGDPVIVPGQLDFLDAKYVVADRNGNAAYKNIQYGTGSVNGGEQLPLYLDLYRPAGPGLPEQLPGIILIHGGAFKGGSKLGDSMPELANYFASRGYIAVSMDYRLTTDNPDEIRPTDWASSDASQAFQWMVANSGEGGLTEGLMVDKIAIAGGSAGAQTALVMAHSNFASAQPKAVLNFWGGYLLSWSVANQGDPAVFTVHGTNDDIVDISAAQRVADECQAHNIPFELITVAGGRHVLWDEVFNDSYAGQTIIEHATDFLYEHLGLGTVSEGRLDTLEPGALTLEPGDSFLSLYWRVQDDMLYDLHAADSLPAQLQDWPIYESEIFQDMPSGGDGIMVLQVPMDSSSSFYIVNEKSN